MKKIILVLMPVIILSNTIKAQIIWSVYSQSFPTGTTDKPSNIGIITAIPELNNSFWLTHNNAGLQASLANDASFQHNRPKDFVAVNTFDTSKAQFFLHGVNKSNAEKYEYRVMDWQGKIIAPWGNITKFTDDAVVYESGMPRMAYLGGYATSLGNKIIVDVRKKGSDRILTSSVVAWVPIRPVISGIYTLDELNILLKRLSRSWSYRQSPEEINKWSKKYPSDQLDKITRLPKKLILEPTDNNLVFYLAADIYNKEQVEYELIKNNKIFVPWKTNDFDNNIVWLTNLKSGEYLLKIRYSAQRQHVTDYPFEIKTPWYQSNWFIIISGFLISVSFAFAVSLFFNFRQKQKAKEELSNKTKLQLELKSIYAQLNPHFIFNAMSSIQGLINKQDIKAANSYLTDFAKLMRSSLNNANKEQTSLDQEILSLETYLKLEQLRFGFKYEIRVDKNINIYETEIPSLLLQPLVENAVKHGVSDLEEKGAITLNFVMEQNNMVVTITDNGSGFAVDKVNGGFGLKLTNDRIKLLNELLSDQAILFEIKENSPTGTRIYLTFKNWFL